MHLPLRLWGISFYKLQFCALQIRKTVCGWTNKKLHTNWGVITFNVRSKSESCDFFFQGKIWTQTGVVSTSQTRKIEKRKWRVRMDGNASILIAGPRIRVVKTKWGTPNPKAFSKTRKEQKTKQKEKKKSTAEIEAGQEHRTKEKVEHYSEVGQRHCLLLWNSV